MAKERSEFLEYVLELLEPAGGISSRRMFGGYVIHKDTLPIALIFGDEIYFKVDNGNRADYEAMGSKPFAYKAKGKTIIVSNWKVPVEILEDPDRVLEWAEKARQAAIRARQNKG